MTGGMVLQSNLDKLLEGDIFGFVVGVFTDPMPLPILALLVFGSIGTGYYITQRNIAIPLVMFIMVGGTTIALAPTIFQQAILGSFVIGIAGIIYVIFNRVRV